MRTAPVCFLLSLACPAALAATAAVQFGNSQTQLFDLAPDDGVSPSLMGGGSMADRPPPIIFQNVVGDGQVTRLNPWEVSVEATTFSSQALASYSYESRFYMTPHTRLTISEPVQVFGLLAEGELAHTRTTMQLRSSGVAAGTGQSASFDKWFHGPLDFADSQTLTLSFSAGEDPAYITLSRELEAGAWVNVVPEPSTYTLMLAGLAAIGLVARRRRA